MPNPSKSLTWRAFAVPKAGHGQDEYEDACAANPAAGRFAIADGASESSFARAWADLLVNNFTQQAGRWSRWLPAARSRWHDSCQDQVISWYAEDKFLAGAYATFLGIAFQPPDFGSWHAAAVGDACLFHVRGGRLLRAFPVRHAHAFGSQPVLMGARKASRKTKRLHARGDWRENDTLLLMTDALAHWFLDKAASGTKPWDEALAVTTQDAFETWIAALRQTAGLRNDDVTLMVISDSVV